MCRVCINTAALTLPYPTRNHLEDKVGPPRACGLQVDEGADPGRPPAPRPEAVRSLTLATGASRLLVRLTCVPQLQFFSQTSRPGRRPCTPQRPLQHVARVLQLCWAVCQHLFSPHVAPWHTGRGGQASRAKLVWAACLRHPSSDDVGLGTQGGAGGPARGASFSGLASACFFPAEATICTGRGASLHKGCRVCRICTSLCGRLKQGVAAGSEPAGRSPPRR